MSSAWWCCAEKCGKADSGGTLLVKQHWAEGKGPSADEVLPVDDTDPPEGLEACGQSQQSARIITLARQEGMSWGLDLEVTPAKDVLIIADVFESHDDMDTVGYAHNQNAPADKQIVAGDYIVKVNGRADAVSMTRLLASELEVTLEMKSPTIHKIVVPKKGRSLGLTLKYLSNGNSVFIGTMEPSGAATATDLAPGDRIVAVNGHTLAAVMVQELRATDEPEISIARLS